MPVDKALFLSRDAVAHTESSQLLRRIQEWIFATRPNCLIHPHGFYVVLLHKDDVEEWRFHVWPRGTRTITGMPGFIHTHNKIVESKILKGELSNVVYSVEEVDKGGAPVYEVEYVGNRYISSATNILVRRDCRVVPKAVSNQLMRTDGMYMVPAHVFHQASVSESISTATIVCMHSAAAGAIKVIGRDGYPNRIEFQRRVCSAIEAAECTI